MPSSPSGMIVSTRAEPPRSSRQIERSFDTDVAFRIACGGAGPDHTTIARFHKVHSAAFVEVFTQVLAITAGAGLGRFGTVAIDGTKIPANAAAFRNRDWLAAQARLIVADATVEPAIGNLKRLLPRFSRRSLQALGGRLRATADAIMQRTGGRNPACQKVFAMRLLMRTSR